MSEKKVTGCGLECGVEFVGRVGQFFVSKNPEELKLARDHDQVWTVLAIRGRHDNRCL